MSSDLVGNETKKVRKKPNRPRGSKGTSNKPKIKSKKPKNLLTLIPIRNCKWTKQEKNPELIRILKSRFDTKLGKSLGDKLKIKDTYNINLDEYGTAVWQLCDGKQTVKEIGEILKIQFDQAVEPLYPRLAAFFQILESNDVIILDTPPPKKKIKRV